ncbi:MAG: hypothetical protein AB7Q29_08510 [Vicinamibacterales bacterium]
MATASTAAAGPSLPRPEGILVLRWTYRRQGDVLNCELALTPDFSAYELHVSAADAAGAPISELFDDAICAFQRQAGIERRLIEDGWHLERFARERLEEP